MRRGRPADPRDGDQWAAAIVAAETKLGGPFFGHVGRPNGGHNQHAIRGDSSTAICGYSPSSPKGHIFYRGCWAFITDGTVDDVS